METKDDTSAREKVANEKDLGVIIDIKLSFGDHIASKIKLANRNLGIIFRTFTYLHVVTEMFPTLYCQNLNTEDSKLILFKFIRY